MLFVLEEPKFKEGRNIAIIRDYPIRKLIKFHLPRNVYRFFSLELKLCFKVLHVICERPWIIFTKVKLSVFFVIASKALNSTG